MKRGLKRYNSATVKAGVILTACLAISGPALGSVLDRPFLRVSSIVIVMGGTDFANNGGNAPFAVDFNVLDNVSSGVAAPDIIGVDGVTMTFDSEFSAIDDGEGAGYEFEITGAVSGGEFTSNEPQYALDANDSYSAFEIDEDTDMTLNLRDRATQFLVVSNTQFDIYAQATDLVATGDFSSLGYENISYDLAIETTGGSGAWQWGQQAQDPSIGGLGTLGLIDDLGDISASFTKVFDGGRRTAAQRGTLLQQAVSFESRYSLQSTSLLGTGLLGGAATPDISDYDLSMGAGELGATVTYTVYTP